MSELDDHVASLRQWAGREPTVRDRVVHLVKRNFLSIVGEDEHPFVLTIQSAWWAAQAADRIVGRRPSAPS